MQLSPFPQIQKESSAKMSAFRVETLLAGLKDIQQEKSRLECMLNERRNRRRYLEQEREAVTGKCMQVKDIHTKMNETLKVALHKVAQTQSLANSLDGNNLSFKKGIVDLNQQIDAERKKQMEEVIQFEDNLADVSNQMLSARNIYSDENLNCCWTEAEKLEQELNQKVINYQNCLREMETDFEKLKLKPVEEPYFNDIPVDLRKTLWSFFQDEHRKANKCLQEIQNDLTSGKQMMEDVNSSI